MRSLPCVECGGVDGRKTSIGVGGAVGPINAPTVFNSVFNVEQFWDGRAATLQDQAGGPPLNPIEMASKLGTKLLLSWKKIRSLKRSSSTSIRKVSVAKILLMPLLNLRKH